MKFFGINVRMIFQTKSVVLDNIIQYIQYRIQIQLDFVNDCDDHNKSKIFSHPMCAEMLSEGGDCWITSLKFADK